jgi:putative membrane protein
MPLGRQATLIVWFAGVFVLAGLTIWYGADEVAKAIVSAGWATLLVLVIRTVMVGVEGLAWWVLFPADLRPRLWHCVSLRFVREATSALLPVAQVGGDIIGARCLTLTGTRGPIAAASVIVDVLLQGVTQVLFTVTGLVLLSMWGGNELVAWPVAIGLAIVVPILALVYCARGERGHRMASRVLRSMVGNREWRIFGALDELFARLESLYGYRKGLLLSGLYHLAVWFLGATEVWLVLNFMGYPIGFEQAVIIESLLHAVRGAAFVVPGAVGAQEGGLIVLCAMFGIPPEAALALSLVKRVPDLLIGVPGIIAWQAMEGLHFGRRGREPKGRT